jgi:site-specific recombinase XerC
VGTENAEVIMNTPTPLPPLLTHDALKRLLSEHTIELPARTRFALGHSGLSAAEVAALDVNHVSIDGVQVRSIIVVPNRDGRRPHLAPTRRHPISDDARWLLGCWLDVRRSRCEHHRRLMRTTMDDRGVVRCAACGEIHDLLKTPLFDSRESERMSVSAIRHEFQRARDQLGLDPAYHFDTLRETYLNAHLWARGVRGDQK